MAGGVVLGQHPQVQTVRAGQQGRVRLGPVGPDQGHLVADGGGREQVPAVGADRVHGAGGDAGAVGVGDRRLRLSARAQAAADVLRGVRVARGVVPGERGGRVAAEPDATGVLRRQVHLREVDDMALEVDLPRVALPLRGAHRRHGGEVQHAHHIAVAVDEHR